MSGKEKNTKEKDAELLSRLKDSVSASAAAGYRPLLPDLKELNCLQPQIRMFVAYYCDPHSPTYGKPTASYIASGYKGNSYNGLRATAGKVLMRPAVKAAIAAYASDLRRRAVADHDYIWRQWLALLEDCRDAAGRYTDRPTAAAVLRTMAQARAMLTDRVEQTGPQSPELTDAERAELQRLAREHNLRLAAG